MKDGKNVTIVMLLMSAVVLSVLASLAFHLPPAQAGNSGVRFNHYIMTPGARADSFDNIYIIDVLSKRLNVYSLDPNRKRMDLKDSLDLAKYFRTTGTSE